VLVTIIRANLAVIPVDGGADQSLVRGEKGVVRRGTPHMEAGPVEGTMPLTRKKRECSLEMACFGESMTILLRSESVSEKK